MGLIDFHAFGSFPGGEADGEGLQVAELNSSTGFTMRAYPERGLTSLAEWLSFLENEKAVIVQGSQTYTPDQIAVLARNLIRRREGLVDRARHILNGGSPYYADAEGVQFSTKTFD